MPDVIEQLQRYGEALERFMVVSLPDVESTDRRSRGRRGWSIGVAAALALGVAVVTAFLATRDPTDSRVTTSATRPSGTSAPPGPGVFSTPTGVVLLSSDGIDGATAIDLDHRVAGRRPLEGERAGDQPYRMTRVGDQLVLGWGEIYAAPLAGGASRHLDTATIYLPAAEGGQVWTIDYQGGRINFSAPAEVRRIDMSGRVVFRATIDPQAAVPLIGVPGGLAVQTPSGVAIWDAESGTVGPVLGPGRTNTAASNGTHLAWCDDTCTNPQIATLPRPGPPTPEHVGLGAELSLSPNDRTLALLRPSRAVAPPTPDAPGELVLIDIAAGTRDVISTPPLDAFGGLQWSPDGTQLFYASSSYQQSNTTVGRLMIATGDWEQSRIPVGGSLGFIVVRPREANSFFPPELTTPDQCRAPGIFPSGRAGACGFRF